jgi:hypothetical protein
MEIRQRKIAPNGGVEALSIGKNRPKTCIFFDAPDCSAPAASNARRAGPVSTATAMRE